MHDHKTHALVIHDMSSSSDSVLAVTFFAASSALAAASAFSLALSMSISDRGSGEELARKPTVSL